ncbi:MarR family winged helix-turn-helix transcriptional regulator [Streptosporangium sp. NPDC051022]|uniref:MarR family winged helix-turn-helix transcriptional regulator n=1 Tax=Streptosporangium sp. NPDC051022 TaxID=3155752 RepID=UPI00342D3F23
MAIPQFSQSLLDQDVFVLSRLAVDVRRRLTERLAELGMNRWDVAVLAVLADHGPTVQRAVGARLGVDPSDMVEMVERLVTAGRVERRRDPADRRRYVLTPTPQGLRMFHLAREEERRLREALLAPLDEERREEWRAMLRLLYDHLRTGGLDAPHREPAPSSLPDASGPPDEDRSHGEDRSTDEGR